MTALVISDLHLGSSASTLGISPVRERLIAECQEADQLILLGDVLALRERPLADVMARARPVLESLNEAMAGRRIVIVPGNHDHLVASTIASAPAHEMPLETIRPLSPDHSNPVSTLCEWLGDCDPAVAYPGIWVRPDVYATHGHYLDCHLRVPRIESLAAAAMQAIGRPLPQRPRVRDYEAVLAPMYAFANARAQTLPHDGDGGPASHVVGRAWDSGMSYLVARPASSRIRARAALLAAAGAVSVLNRAGLGRFRSDLTPDAIRVAGIDAMARVVSGLRIQAEHVVFGHTHAAGPLVGQEPWRLPTGTRLTNAGSWVYAPRLITSGGRRDPYWPGTAVTVPEQGDPKVRSLLADLAAPVAA